MRTMLKILLFVFFFSLTFFLQVNSEQWQVERNWRKLVTSILEMESEINLQKNHTPFDTGQVHGRQSQIPSILKTQTC